MATKSAKVVRRRITSVRKTQQITKAMKMVAAAKLRRAQERALHYKPFAQDVQTALLRVLLRIRRLAAEDPRVVLPAWATASPPGPKMRVVVVAGERGLCGSFNSGLFRMAERWLKTQTAREIAFVTVGRKSRDYFQRRKMTVDLALTAPQPNFDQWIPQVRDRVLEACAAGVPVFVASNELVTLTTQKPVIHRLLPVELPEGFALDPNIAWATEPPLVELGEKLLPLYVEARLRQILYESEAGEHSARMSAMENATKNAREMIDRLTLEMNKARQAAITKELMDIVNGAEALKG
ncbi:MAG: ATP synthase F1 subunit gamma [Nitrospirae bacterium]|nr:ATP synthase F1 subunit gamma [Nitrospirota bacterium]